MKFLFRLIFLATLFSSPSTVHAAPFVLSSGKNLTVSYPESSRPVLKTAIEILGYDIHNVFGDTVETVGRDAALEIAINPVTVKDKQGFRIAVDNSGKLVITAHDSHGAAYGVMELSRMIGVSPWEWWADAAPEQKDRFELPPGLTIEQSPSVEYRGIFINDEDWGLKPWSSRTYEPSDIPGRIGPETNAKIFELMLRLRANTYWPAMHECTVPFFLTEGNRETAEKYGIYIGGSHCEPMACNAAGEWSRRGKGDYDYVNNSGEVYRFWETRIKDVANQEILYTIGMRGVHDGAMNGAKTIEEQKAVLERVFRDQRHILSEYVDKDISKVPQVFIPYKEVLDIYNAGLDVPEDVTLMWCDDNYGYIRHFPSDDERLRKGGNGIYYHVSYWGRPHDYLWLGTFSPYLLFQQMASAYDSGIRKIWILNVGDIKPAEYQIELFMDMAWHIDEIKEMGPQRHLERFLSREFGQKTAKKLLPVMNEHYRLAFIRKPEFMGNTREEEWGNDYYKVVRDLPWSADSLSARNERYTRISDVAENIWKAIPADKKDKYYQLVKYPVHAAAQMNRKMFEAQKARHSMTDWAACELAFDSIMTLTDLYNKGFFNNGKWNRMMDCQPRQLPVFNRPDHRIDSVPMSNHPSPIIKWNGTDATGTFDKVEGLGYESKAIALTKDEPVSFTVPPTYGTDSITVDIRLLPTHPVENGELVFSLYLNDNVLAENIHYETAGRSEEWKENVLRNQAIRRFSLHCDSNENKIILHPKTKGIILDQLIIYRAKE